MAEGGVTVLDETQKELQECPICCTEFKDPRMLDCSHSFCLKCLQELRLTQTKDDKNIVCPLCRRKTALTEAGVDTLPGGSKDQQEQTEGQGLEVMCQACDEGNEAISRCMDCKHYLCQECQKAHNRMAALMKDHKIVALTELPVESQEITDTELKKVPKCFKHPDQDLCLYCNSCEVLICNECTNSDHKESMHSHISIDQAVSRCKQEVNESISKTEEYIKEFISANPVSVDQIRYRLDKMLAKTDSQITLKAEKEIAKIREKEKQLKKEARDIVIKRDREFAYAATPQQTLSKVNAVMTTATCYEILESKKKMLWELNEQVRVHRSLDIKHGKSFLGFKESEEVGQLGTLLLEEKWETDETFLTTINNPQHLAAYSTSELVVALYFKLFTLDPEGKVISTKTYKPDPYKPNEPHDPNDIQKATALAINKDDQLLILDNPAVKIFTKEYQLLHQFLPGKEAGVDATPTCLAVDSSNLIAVGYKDKEQISLHNPDGSLVRTLPAPKIDTHLIFGNKRLIYTNYSWGFLMAVDLHGNKLFTQSCMYPRGLCCDDAGDIYLLESDEICHFSADGKRIASMHDGNPCIYKERANTCKYTAAHKLVFTKAGDMCNTIFMYHLV